MTRKSLDHLDAHARDMAERSLNWADTCWDDVNGFFRMPGDAVYEEGQTGTPGHLVRETAWYALGLLLRDVPNDRVRAFRAINAVLSCQFDAPNKPYHGTWYRSPHEPHPPADAEMWKDYDPNWREFIGTTLAVILLEYESLLPLNLVNRIDLALRRAVVGTLARNVPASYTNIALMTTFLLQFCADRFGEPLWHDYAEQLAVEIQQRFQENCTFDEYNSPTYYGIDLYALALWRSYATSPEICAAGAAMEAELWRDIAQFYHANMRNVVGPYDRSYGMDMQRYVACLGMWSWLATGYEQAAFPRLDKPFEHAWDFMAAPLFALLGARIPDDARPHFLAFQGERQIERVIVAEPRRVATAWIGERVMLGAEDSNCSHRTNSEQFHPVTIHWRMSDNQLGWMRLKNMLPINAHAEQNHLSIICDRHNGGDLAFVFEMIAPNVKQGVIQHNCWKLPYLTVRVETNTNGPHIVHNGDRLLLCYHTYSSRPRAPIYFILETEPLLSAQQ